MTLTQLEDRINVTHDEMKISFNRLSLQIFSHIYSIDIEISLQKTENGTTNIFPCIASVERKTGKSLLSSYEMIQTLYH